MDQNFTIRGIWTCGLRLCLKRCFRTGCAPRASLRWRIEAAHIVLRCGGIHKKLSWYGMKIFKLLVKQETWDDSATGGINLEWCKKLTWCWKYQKMWSGGWGERTRHVMAWEEPTFRKTFFSPSISLAGSEVGAHDSYPPSLCLMFLYHLYFISYMFDLVSPTTCSCTVWLKWGTVFTCRSISFICRDHEGWNLILVSYLTLI